MKTLRLTMAQALVRYLANQRTVIDGIEMPLFGGCWAIFGHGNVAGLGEALHAMRDEFPTFRAHNEQGMAHAAIAYAKAHVRCRMMAVTTSIGPGATNLVTAAALAHANRLPVLLLPGDVFANRRPDPVLQQIEDFGDGTVSANDALRPVSRYFDRITRPEQIMPALDRALAVLTDPAGCGPVTLALCQDVQAEAHDYPAAFFAPRLHLPRRIRPSRDELAAAAALLKKAKRPLVIAGGGVLYSGATKALADFAEKHGMPVVETQAGKSALPGSHPLNLGAIGVTGTAAANEAARAADVVLAAGTRLQDFTTGSWSLFEKARSIIGLNVQVFDAMKHRGQPLVADAKEGLAELSATLLRYRAPAAWRENAEASRTMWLNDVERVTSAGNALPSDAEVIGAVQRQANDDTILVCAAGGLPGELHRLWQSERPGSYHLEYGFSTMGYEIAGGLGVKMARPEADVIIMVGDGSYMMMNSEIATSVMLGLKLTIVLLDNSGYGCINRLQRHTGGESFNNLLKDARHESLPTIDFAAHAASMGAMAKKVSGIAELERELAGSRNQMRTTVLVIDTDALRTSGIGGHWWDVAVPEVSARAEVRAARAAYNKAVKAQRVIG